MKRDMELIRKLLIFLADEHDGEPVKIPPIEGYDTLQIKYHLVLLYDAGFIFAEPTISSTSDRVIEVIAFELKWNGHEFLDAARDPAVWKQAMDKIHSVGGTVTIATLTHLLIYYAKLKLGI